MITFPVTYCFLQYNNTTIYRTSKSWWKIPYQKKINKNSQRKLQLQKVETFGAFNVFTCYTSRQYIKRYTQRVKSWGEEVDTLRDVSYTVCDLLLVILLLLYVRSRPNDVATTEYSTVVFDMHSVSARLWLALQAGPVAFLFFNKKLKLFNVSVKSSIVASGF